MDRTKHIIELIRQRDEEGLRLLYKHYAPALLGISVRIIGDQQLAEEILQKGLMKIWDNIEKYSELKGTFFTWMSTIVRNLSLDQRRSKFFMQSTKTTNIEQVSIGSYDGNLNISKMDTDTLLKNLDEKYLIVLEYLYLRGYTQKELSDEKNIPLGTIKTRLKKALDILRSNLGNETLILMILSLLNSNAL